LNVLGHSLKTQSSTSHPKQSNVIQSSIGDKSEMTEVSKIGMQLDDIITDLDKKLNRVLAK